MYCSISGTDVGQDIVPFLTFSVKTQLRQTVDNGRTFRVGDKVYFHLFLDTQGTRLTGAGSPAILLEQLLSWQLPVL